MILEIGTMITLRDEMRTYRGSIRLDVFDADFAARVALRREVDDMIAEIITRIEDLYRDSVE